MRLIDGKQSELSPGFTVHRLLPSRHQRMVGPFCFLDHAGPVQIKAGQNIDVRPHPHIGLSTLTYLLEGRQRHRDSLGTVIDILPGDINLMTAGRGISHSERSWPEDRDQERRLHLLQFWLALPDGQEERAPQFFHYDQDELPKISTEKLTGTVLVGDFLGATSPVETYCPTRLCDFQAKQSHLFESESNLEQALVPLWGEIRCEEQIIQPSQIAVFKPSEKMSVRVSEGARWILLGGQPFQTDRHMWWNFVSSSKEHIEKAKHDWKSGVFPQVPGETEKIPLPSDSFH